MRQGKTVVAVLDDESNMRLALKRLLNANGFAVEVFETGEAFLDAAQKESPDCLLLDLHMPRTTGFDVLGSLDFLQIPTPAIIITGHDEPGNAERAHQLGAADYLLKPIDESLLMDAIHRACPKP